MTEEAVREFFADLAASRFDALASRLHDDVVFTFPGERFGGRFEGMRKVLVFLKMNQRLFQGGLAFDVLWVGIAGDRAVAQWTNAGKTKTGTDYANRGVTVFRFDDDKIVAIDDYLDTEVLAKTWPS